jgi:hypothetical protein
MPARFGGSIGAPKGNSGEIHGTLSCKHHQIDGIGHTLDLAPRAHLDGLRGRTAGACGFLPRHVRLFSSIGRHAPTSLADSLVLFSIVIPAWARLFELKHRLTTTNSGALVMSQVRTRLSAGGKRIRTAGPTSTGDAFQNTILGS